MQDNDDNDDKLKTKVRLYFGKHMVAIRIKTAEKYLPGVKKWESCPRKNRHRDATSEIVLAHHTSATQENANPTHLPLQVIEKLLSSLLLSMDSMKWSAHTVRACSIAGTETPVLIEPDRCSCKTFIIMIMVLIACSRIEKRIWN